MTDYEIDDEDNLVDKAKKRSIVEKRDEIDEWRKELIPKAKFGEISEAQAVSLIHDRVRDYIMAVEPVMRHKSENNVQDAKNYYMEKEIGTVFVPVPEPFNRPEAHGIEYKENPPRPKAVTIKGLRTVIESESVSAEWEKQVRWKGESPPRKTISFSNSMPFSREVLRNAVRITDMWLQDENLGIAVKDEVEVGEDDIDPL